MRSLIILSLLLVCSYSFAQDWDFEAPNYKRIEKNIKKKSSNLYYDTLMSRYQNSDSTMTLEEKRHLYYGYSFQDKYTPYGTSDYNDSLQVMMQKGDHDKADLNKIIRYGDSLLKDNPFDLRALNLQGYALDRTANIKALNKKVIQFRMIVDAILSSGSGMSKKDAFYVIYTTHEYDLLGILGFDFGGSQSLVEHYDYLEVAENEAGLDGLYFDVSPCLNSLSSMFKD